MHIRKTKDNVVEINLNMILIIKPKLGADMAI